MTTAVSVQVTVDDAHMSDLPGVAKELKAKGLKNVQVLEAVGIVLGKIAPARRQSLQSVQGVMGVEDQSQIDIGPPDAPVQ